MTSPPQSKHSREMIFIFGMCVKVEGKDNLIVWATHKKKSYFCSSLMISKLFNFLHLLCCSHNVLPCSLSATVNLNLLAMLRFDFLDQHSSAHLPDLLSQVISVKSLCLSPLVSLLSSLRSPPPVSPSVLLTLLYVIFLLSSPCCFPTLTLSV